MFETRTAPRTGQDPAPHGHVRGRPRTDKVDLGVGVYRSPEGVTPIMAAVKTAERRIWETQETKSYVGIPGRSRLSRCDARLILGDAVPASRVAGCATPGGTGAVRQVLEMTRWLSPEATVWISDPTWPNHPAILDHLSQKSATYRYYDRRRGASTATACWPIWRRRRRAT
jgi:aspartate aminotransferase